jgi:hypothetical protein
MGLLKPIVLFLIATRSLWVIAVEYQIDPPLDLTHKWKFARHADYYVQHQCSQRNIDLVTIALRDALTSLELRFGKIILKTPLQLRFFANAHEYRKAHHFSRSRDGHFNPILNIVSTHCFVAKELFTETLVLYYLAGTNLRPWQRIFAAETLRFADDRTKVDSFTDAKRENPELLTNVLLSNYTPGIRERATLRQLAELLATRGRLSEFLTLLIAKPQADDTGIDLLESILGTDIRDIQNALLTSEKASNNTLRNLRK